MNIRRILSILPVAAALLLSGCSSAPLVPVQENEFVSLPPSAYQAPAAPVSDSRSERTARTMLYFIASDQQQLTGIYYTIRATGNQTLEEAAVMRLLSSTPVLGLIPVAPEGTALRGMEISQGVATVDLTVEALTAQPQDLMRMIAAITVTLTQFDSVSCVNVLIGGRAPYAYDLPVGARTATEGSLTGLIAQQQSDTERYLADPAQAQIERQVVLYFSSWQDDLLVPEVASIRLTSGNIARDVIAAMTPGPKDTSISHRVLPADAVLLRDPVTEIQDDGRRVLRLDFNEGFTQSLSQAGLSLRQSLCALTYTLVRFLPEIDALTVYEGDQPIRSVDDAQGRTVFRQGLITADSFDHRIGRSVQLYFAGNSGKLERAQRVLDLASAVSPRALLSQLIQGPYVFDGALHSAIPDGVTEADVLGIRQEDNLLLVNFSDNFYRLCQSLNESEERLLAYAIVNTLSEMDGIDRVQFYFAGEIADTLSGNICLTEPLIANPDLTG